MADVDGPHTSPAARMACSRREDSDSLSDAASAAALGLIGATDVDSLTRGCMVRIHGLVGRADLNGQRGTLLESNSSVRRYWAKVRSGSPVRITHSSYSAGILELYLLELLERYILN